MNAKHNHPRVDIIEDIGEFEIFIPAMNIIQAIADLISGDNIKLGKKKLKPSPSSGP